MQKTAAESWARIATALPATPAQTARADTLLAAYEERGHLVMSCRELLSLDDAVIARFYAGLVAAHGTASPVAGAPDSGWMQASDFCFVNPKATGLGGVLGNFIQAAKLLPGVRANAIHLSPFTDFDHNCIYIVKSLLTVSPLFVHRGLAEAGFDGFAQVRAFVDACHGLGKTVGFDLEPHCAQFARTVLMHPECFRWIRLDAARLLAEGLTMDGMLALPVQERIAAEVRALVAAGMDGHGVDSLEAAPDDTPALRRSRDEAYFTLIGRLIEAGYWTIPCHAWDGVGLPEFGWYDVAGNFPRFRYYNRQGEDRAALAYTALTPIRFSNGLAANRLPCTGAVEPYLPGIELFAGAFRFWRDLFDFDFVRYDSVDHVFDSVLDGDPELPASDRPTPAVLARAVAASRADGHPWIGNLAERMGNEATAYAGLGFDLMLGDDMLGRIDRTLLEKTFRLYDELAGLNADRPSPFAICFAVDTHDTGNPHLWGEPLVALAGPRRMHLRHFVARFASCGKARRPKYEAMGSQDLSYGLYRANVRNENLHWVGDAAYNRAYHALEDAWEKCRPILAGGEIVRRYVDDRIAWWTIRSPQGALACLVSLETGEGWDCGGFSLDLADAFPPAAGTVEMPVGQADAACRFRIEPHAIHMEHLAYLGCCCWSWRFSRSPLPG